MKYILLIVLILSFSQTTYWFKSGLFASDLTIKELSENVEKLKEEKTNLEEKSKQVQKEKWELSSFLRKNLSEKEVENITKELEKYQTEKEKIEQELSKLIEEKKDTEKTKRKLLQLKLDFYKYLAKYIEKSKKDKFIEHISFNIVSTKERKDLIEDINTMEELLDTKVTYIKDKIEDHKANLEKTIEASITEKIQERIDAIDTDKKYAWISKEAKKKIYQDFLEQIKIKQAELEKSNLSESYKKTRALIFETMVKKIEEKINQ